MTNPPGRSNAPRVGTVTGLGTGGAAGVVNDGADADDAAGRIECRVGTTPSASGTVVLTLTTALPAAAGGYWAAADWATVAVTGSNPYTLTWTANRTLLAGERLQMAYQWVSSQ